MPRTKSSNLFSYSTLSTAIFLSISLWSGRAAALEEFTIPCTCTSNAQTLARGPDGAMWFTDTGSGPAGSIGRLTTAGQITSFPIPTSNSRPLKIVAGPDGNMWFTENNLSANKIGRITTSGQITEFTVPTANSLPAGLTVGPDGNLWFTENNSGKIGRITPAGVITEFSLGSGLLRPFSITAASDGALWFTEMRNNQIGRITTSGSFQFFNLPSTTSGANFITNGADGALWFTESGAVPHKIGRMTVSATPTVNEYTVPTPNADPQDLTVGPDGAIWFAELNLGKVGRISETGVITEYQGRSGSTPEGIAAGPDGLIYFTESFRIARLPTTEPSIGPPPSPSPLVSATLPASRSVQIGNNAATAFATIINTSSVSLTGCAIVPVGIVPAIFSFQTTDPSTNGLTGSPNQLASIGPGGTQTFVISFTPTAAFFETDVVLGFFCSGADAASIVIGLNTIALTFSINPVPDVIALALAVDPGIVDLPGQNGAGAFAVSTFNLGASSTISVVLDTGFISLPIALTVCPTDSNANCLQSPAGSYTFTMNNSAVPTFSVFVRGLGTVPFSPAYNRVFVRFVDTFGIVRGSTSVAVRTQ